MERKRLTFEERKTIEELYNACWYVPDIADYIGKAASTIYKELHRGRTGKIDRNGRIGYSAEIGQKTYLDNLSSRVKSRRKAENEKENIKIKKRR